MKAACQRISLPSAVQLRDALAGLLAALLLSAVSCAHAQTCPPAGRWLSLTGAAPRTVLADAAIADLARHRVVLLGEHHDNVEHHRWQLHTVAALQAVKPRLVLGFEMFP